MYFDTHAHYDDEAFDADRDELINSMRGKSVEFIVNPGCGKKSSLAAISMAEKYEFMWAAVGWHPQEADEYDECSPELLRQWAKHPKVKAIGEIGLDYHYEPEKKELQRIVLREQLEIARELELPVIIHDREAHGDCMEILSDFKDLRGVFHCYSGSLEMAEVLIGWGWYLSFTGAITFKNAKKAPAIIAAVPDDRYMLETDCPYLAPEPNRGHRNDSGLLPYIAEAVGRARGITAEQAAKQALENGRRFFGI